MSYVFNRPRLSKSEINIVDRKWSQNHRFSRFSSGDFGGKWFISSWISAGKLRAFGAPQISANKILLLPVTGSTSFHGHHFMHLKDILWFQHVLKMFTLAHFCAVHVDFLLFWIETDSTNTWVVGLVGHLLFSGPIYRLVLSPYTYIGIYCIKRRGNQLD